MYSVDSEEEARALIVATCKRGLDGRFYAPELAQEQSLVILQAFSDRLEKAHEAIMARPDQKTS